MTLIAMQQVPCVAGYGIEIEEIVQEIKSLADIVILSFGKSRASRHW